MSTHSTPRTGASSFLRRRDCPNAVVCCVFLAVGATLVGLQVKLPVAGSGTSVPGENLTRKGDRLPLIALSTRNKSHKSNVLNTPNDQHLLPDGCEPLASFLVQTPASRTAGRCLS